MLMHTHPMTLPDTVIVYHRWRNSDGEFLKDNKGVRILEFHILAKLIFTDIHKCISDPISHL